MFLVINVNDFVIKCKFDNFYGCRYFLSDGIMCVIDVMIVFKMCWVVGYGDVGKGFVVVFKVVGVCVIVFEIDSICAF